MINNKTVLILGAGASRPYGFPLASELKKEIIDLTRQIINPGLGSLLLECGFSQELISEFNEVLAGSQTDSIDAFLEYRPEFSDVGRAAIAARIFPREIQKNFEIENWYQYLFQRMSAPFERFSENKLSIVTYNYDRSIECFLFNALKYRYGKTVEECANALGHIPIVHLHGVLGPLRGLNLEGIPYGAGINANLIKVSAKNVKIVHEVDAKLQYAEAHELIKNATRICFLGFSFNPLNMNRLLAENVWREKGYIRGTAYGMTQAEKKLIEAQIPLFELGNPAWDNLQLLRETTFLQI